MKPTLYRFFGEDGRLLYVGRTCAPGKRMSGHRRSKDWWTEIATIRLEHVQTAALLARLERHAIATERPLYNEIREVRYQSKLGFTIQKRMVLAAIERLGPGLHTARAIAIECGVKTARGGVGSALLTLYNEGVVGQCGSIDHDGSGWGLPEYVDPDCGCHRCRYPRRVADVAA